MTSTETSAAPRAPVSNHPALSGDRAPLPNLNASEAGSTQTEESAAKEHTSTAVPRKGNYRYTRDLFLSLSSKTVDVDLEAIKAHAPIWSEDVLPSVLSLPVTPEVSQILASGSVNSEVTNRRGGRGGGRGGAASSRPVRKEDREEGFRKFIAKVQTTEEYPAWATPGVGGFVDPAAMQQYGNVPARPSLPLWHEDPTDVLWFYSDPQGNIQGPFTGADMHEWYKAGFFTAQLLIKREHDHDFVQLGLLVQLLGNDEEPFLLPAPVSLTDAARVLAAAEFGAGNADAEQYAMYDNAAWTGAEAQNPYHAERQQLVGVLQQRTQEATAAHSWSKNGQPGTVPKSLREIQEEEEQQKKASQ